MKALDYYQDLGYDFLAYARPHIFKKRFLKPSVKLMVIMAN
ncbi:MAG: hypothetical protein RCH30_1930 [Candidatus Phytoplasma australasiaticum]|nr:MAG: hypothetical protein TB2022_2070 [Candidatus Phytoplasma aurantifolia]WKV64228.1 MAG: hypothetical protein NCHU2022_c3940 [Candidatus Phytoplasma australasiaticum]WMW50086.1 MAG: hypothetical protein RCH30_1930 [Candidatus Phytoplasma australasiaticum]